MYENPFQLGFIFIRLCQLEMILQIVPSTAWNESQKGRVAYLLLLTMWMWESRGFGGVHNGYFASILWQAFSLFESICTTHGHTLLSIENIFLESGMVTYSMRGKTLYAGSWEIHSSTQKDNILLCCGNRIFPAISVTPVKKAGIQWHEWRIKIRGLLLHIQTQGSWHISPSVCVIDRQYISEIFNILHCSLLCLYFQQLL